jgi:acyl-CoA reductase-like NAD-dependent aldehyde dehydrogenase
VAVATDREFGLFIGGEASEPASGDIRALTELTTGESLARAAMAGEADVDRAVEAARSAVDGEWGRTSGRGHRIAARIKSGTFGINRPYTAFPRIPFGGYKQSGFGRELALETLDLYLETKSVIVSTGARPINPFGL